VPNGVSELGPSQAQFIAKKPHRKKIGAKKKAGRKPCSENCVDPISPQIWI
jgi:hypothetical protein